MSSSPHHLRLIAAITTFAACAAALGQGVQWRDLKVVEPGVGDVGPVATGTRLLPTDLRQPSGFERVYRVPGSTRGVYGLAPSEAGERLARVDGAITAVFPRSEYVKTKKGIRPVFPADTIFYIGNSPLLDLPAPAAPHERSVNAVSYAYGVPPSTMQVASLRASAELADLRVHPGEDRYFEEPARPLKPDEPPPAANVFTDEQFRRARIRSLLMSAVARGE